MESVDTEIKGTRIQASADEDWDLVIKPKDHLLDINLKEIWHYRDLLYLLVKRDFVAQYKQTVLGPIWHILQPLFTTVIFLLIFGKIAGIPVDGIRPVLFYMSGLTIWTYFSNVLTLTSTTFVANASIFGKVYFPRMIIPLSIVGSNIVRFGIQFLVLFCVMVFYALRDFPLTISHWWLLIPFLVVIMAGLGLGFGIIISSITTKYRDFHIIITFGVQLLLYVTPIAYPFSFLRGKWYAQWIEYNPLTGVVEAFRYALFQKGTLSWNMLGYSTLCMVIILTLGLIMFNRVQKTFMDTV